MPGPNESAEQQQARQGSQHQLWLYSLIGVAGLSAGGVTGTVVTNGQLQTTVQNAEVRLGGKLDLLGTKVERAIADTDRLSARQDKLAERIAAMELENARRGSAPR